MGILTFVDVRILVSCLRKRKNVKGGQVFPVRRVTPAKDLQMLAMTSCLLWVPVAVKSFSVDIVIMALDEVIGSYLLRHESECDHILSFTCKHTP